MRPTVACTSEHYESIIDQNNHIGTEIDLSLIDNSGEGSKACGTKPSVLNPRANNFISTTELNPLADPSSSCQSNVSVSNDEQYGPLATDQTMNNSELDNLNHAVTDNCTEGSKACERIPLALNPLAKNFNPLTGYEFIYTPLRLTGGGETSFEYQENVSIDYEDNDLFVNAPAISTPVRLLVCECKSPECVTDENSLPSFSELDPIC